MEIIIDDSIKECDNLVRIIHTFKEKLEKTQ